jgi:hypothetical protein
VEDLSSIPTIANKTNKHQGFVYHFFNNWLSFVGVTADDHMMKVETVHCSACSVYVPALHSSVQQHLKSPEHIKGKQVTFPFS